MSETGHRFSKRTAWDLSRSSLSEAIAEARVAGRDSIDLTVSNPTRCGFDYDLQAVLGPLSAAEISLQALIYDPDPRGMRSAREAVVHYYADHGASLNVDQIVLTTSTSEAYSYLFRLLCDAGDEVLVAQPSYPLFEFLADLDDVVLKPYPLFYDFGWWIDFAELERRICSRTRAIIVVHPNNPTGHWTHQAERKKLEELCERCGLALIIDEVFLDYPIAPSGSAPADSFTVGPHHVPTFVLSGISKICALPQMKVAWIASCGPAQAVDEALSRLEMISDTFLSMNAPAQLALSTWLADRKHLQNQIQARTKMNLQHLIATRLAVLHLEAGWSAVVRLPYLARTPAGTFAEWLVSRAAVHVHPGGYYGFADSRMIVISLLTPVEIFRLGVEKICLAFSEVNLTGYPLP